MFGRAVDVDVMLSEKIGFNGAYDYDETRQSIFDSISDLSTVLGIRGPEIANFSTNFFKVRNQTLDVLEIKKCVDTASEYSSHILVLLPMLLTINSVRFIHAEEDLAHFFLALCKKAKFSAAELGDEDNESFISACVKIIDYSFAEEIEATGVSPINPNVNFNDVVTDEFKTKLWARIDRKLEALKHLKEEVGSDAAVIDNISEAVTIAQKQKSGDTLPTSTAS